MDSTTVVLNNFLVILMASHVSNYFMRNREFRHRLPTQITLFPDIILFITLLLTLFDILNASAVLSLFLLLYMGPILCILQTRLS